MAGSDIVQSLVRGLEIIELVSASESGMKVNDIAEELGLKVTTVHNLIKTLVFKGYLEKQTFPLAYIPGPAVRGLYDNSKVNDYEKELKGIIRKLSENLPESIITYSVIENKQVKVRYRISPDQPGELQEPVDRYFNLYASASGLTILAFADYETTIEMRELYPFYEYGIYQWKSLDKLNEFLDNSKSHGYAQTPFPNQELLRIGFPDLNKKGELIGVFGVSTGTRFVKDESTKNSIISTAQEVIKRK